MDAPVEEARGHQPSESSAWRTPRLRVDENSDVHADGFVDDDIRELLDDAFLYS